MIPKLRTIWLRQSNLYKNTPLKFRMEPEKMDVCLKVFQVKASHCQSIGTVWGTPLKINMETKGLESFFR